MEKQYFSLEHADSNRLVRIFQLMFGAICIFVALGWLYLVLTSLGGNLAMWVTIFFLAGFGLFQIRAGMGHATRFIEIGGSTIRYRKNSFLNISSLSAGDLKKIDIYPLSMTFFRENGNPLIIRFGTTYTDRIEPVKEAVESFAASHGINFEIKSEL